MTDFHLDPTPASLRSTASWHLAQAKRKRKNKRDAERHRSIANELREKAKQMDNQ